VYALYESTRGFVWTSQHRKFGAEKHVRINSQFVTSFFSLLGARL